jgi:hypothetical protein
MLEWHSDMPHRRVVVDGSNIATEGRTTPSLEQLNEAVLSFLRDYPDAEITVVVDASFGHRIDPSEVAEFEAAEAAGELVSPPAGAIGRGDAFLLRIAGKIGATVLSNDSFQEFHGDHEWLFDEGRLIGGKPVPGVGWIFTPRTPVRGVKSRKAVKEAKGKKGEPLASGEPLAPMPLPSKPPPRRRAKADAAARPAKSAEKAEKAAAKPAEKRVKPAKPLKEEKVVQRAIELAAEESIAEPDAAAGHKRRRKRRTARPAEPVNEPLPFITFIATHKLGMEVEGEVETFTSHGAFVLADGARCYIPIVALGDPPPRAARDVLQKGEVRTFVVQALDPQRRGIELALPEFAHVAGTPTEETIEAEIAGPTGTGLTPKGSTDTKAVKTAKARKAPAKKAPDGATKKAGTKKAATKKAATKRTAAAKRTAAVASPAAGAGKSKLPTEATAPGTEAELVGTEREMSAVTTGPAKGAAGDGTTVTSAPVKKSATKAAVAKTAAKAPATSKKAATPQKAASPKKPTAAKKSAAKKSATKQSAAKKTAAKKAATPKKAGPGK